MGLNIISEKYNGENNFVENVGDIVTGQIEFSHTVEHLFDESNKMFYRDSSATGAGIMELEWSQGDWQAEGFAAGDTFDINMLINVYCDDVWTTTEYITWNGTIASIQPDPKKVILVGILTSTNSTYPARQPQFPSQIVEIPTTDRWGSPDDCSEGRERRYSPVSGVVVRTTRPAEIEFKFNLTPNGSTSQSSVINGQVNRFKHDLPLIADLSTQNMVQLGSKSGGDIQSVTIKQNIQNAGTTTWLLTYKFRQWGFLQDGYFEPDYFDAADCLAPIGEIKVFSVANNPNNFLKSNTPNNTASTGGFNESYNGGVNTFSTSSMTWYDSLGNIISGLDYSGVSTFKAVVQTGGSQTINHRYKLGLCWRPEDSDNYSDADANLNGLGGNLMLNTPNVLFNPNGVVDATVYVGDTSTANGDARWDFSDIKITIVGNTVEVEGRVTPNSECNVHFSTIPDGNRKTSLWLSLAIDAQYTNSLGVQSVGAEGRVSLLLSNLDNIDAPTIGVQIPNVVNQLLLDHAGNEVTDNSVGNTTTEDDVLYTSDFKLPTHTAFSGMRVKISAYNSITQEEFTLDPNTNGTYFSFANVVTQFGVLQLNETVGRNFNLPPSTDRNHISIKRKASLDTVGFAGYTLEYGFLNDWRYWLPQSNVDNDFYDILEPLNGKNKNWDKFQDGNWIMRLGYFTDLDGVEDFNYYKFNIRPYEDDISVTATKVLTLLSDGSNPTALIADELIELEVTFNWNQAFADEWVEFTIEDYQGGNRWVMSSFLEQGNIGNNPLKPLLTQVDGKINVTGSGTATLVAKCLIDTNLIDVNQASLSYRVYSSPNEAGGSIIGAKEMEDGTFKKMESGIIKIID